MNRKTSQFTEVISTDDTTYVPIIQGNPLGNRVIKYDNFVNGLNVDVDEHLGIDAINGSDTKFLNEKGNMVEITIPEVNTTVDNDTITGNGTALDPLKATIKLIYSELAPENPTQGQRWVDTTSGIKYEYIDGVWFEFSAAGTSNIFSGGGNGITIQNVDEHLGIDPISGSTTKFLNEKGEMVEVQSGTNGTTDYADLNNKPSINNITLSGNKTSQDLSLVSQEDLNNYVTHPEIDYLQLSEGILETEIEMILGSLSSSGAYLADAAKMTSKDIAPVEPNSTVTVSNNMNYNIYVRFYDLAGNFVSGLTEKRGTITFIVPPTAYGFKVRTSTNENNLASTIFTYQSDGKTLNIDVDAIETKKGNIDKIRTEEVEFGLGYSMASGVIQGEAIYNEVIITAKDNEFAILNIKAPESNAKESTITLMLDDTNTTQFVDISNMRYDTAVKGAFEIVLQKRGINTPLPYFTVNFNDGLGAGRVKKFTVQPDAIPIEMTSAGLMVRKNNNYNNTGTPDEYQLINLVEMYNKIQELEARLNAL